MRCTCIYGLVISETGILQETEVQESCSSLLITSARGGGGLTKNHLGEM